MTALNKYRLITFISLAVSYALLSLLWDYIAGTETIYLKTISISVIWSGMMTLFFSSFYKKFTGNLLSDEDFKVYHKITVEANISKEELLEKLKTDSYFSKMKIKERESFLKLKNKISWKSWGEIINVEFPSSEEHPQEIKIESYPILKTTLIDYGKNMENVENVKRVIDES